MIATISVSYPPHGLNFYIMKKITSFGACLWLSLALYSCGDALTKGEAEKIVKEARHYPEIEDVPLQYGLLAYGQDSLPRSYYILQQNGMLTVEHLGKGGFLILSYHFRVTLTAKGKAYVTREDRPPVKQGGSGEYMFQSRFKTCDVDFDHLESIQIYPGLNRADIHYTVRKIHCTPFRIYNQNPEKVQMDTLQGRICRAIKTTDGWRPVK